MRPYYEQDGIVIYHGDCREVLPLVRADVVVTDPPYLTDDARVPIRGRGVAPREHETISVGMPWGFGLDWVDWCEDAQHWIVFCNYRMLGPVCSRLQPQTVFVWRKSNAPNMTRPVPRLDCEFIVWSRTTNTSCERMGEFKSQVIDVPMPQAGCMATERITLPGSGRAAHPCQKPLSVVRPFVDRVGGDVVLDPFMGTGTTLIAAQQLNRRAIGIEIEERYCEIAARRLAQGVLPLQEAS